MKIHTNPVGLLETNCYFLETEAHNCAIIDPGAQSEKLLARLQDANLTPQMILLTHGHFDHIGAVNLLQKTYPDLPVFIEKEDEELLQDVYKNAAADLMPNPTADVISNVHIVQDGDKLTLDELELRVIHTPGHTKGGVCYLCGNTAFVGDTLFMDSCGRCDFYGGDEAAMLRSLRRLADLEGDYTVYPGHGNATTLERERHMNYCMRKATE